MPVTFRRRDSLKFAQAEEKIGQAIREGFEPLGDDLVQSLRARSPRDRGRFQRSIKKRISGRGFRTRMIISASAEHAEYVERGRDPGSKPPSTAAILPWVRRRGLGASAFSIKTRRAISAGTRRTFDRKAGKLRTAARSLLQIQKSIAFLIARAIGKRGIKGKFFFKNLKSDYSEKISRALTGIRDRVARILNN